MERAKSSLGVPRTKSGNGFGAGVQSTRFLKGTNIPKPPNNDGAGLYAVLYHPLNVLLVFCPLGAAANFLHWGDVTTFFLNFIALVPLAKVLGDATEELAAGLKNDTLAGLLNATFGNAVEFVIMVQTLRAGMIDVVKASLLGSVLSNLLLVLGMSFFCGGLVSSSKKAPPAPTQSVALSGERGYSAMPACKDEPSDEVGAVSIQAAQSFVGEKVQKFSVLTAMVNASMLLLSTLSFTLVTVFYAEEHHDVHVMGQILLPVSRICSIILMCAYVAYVFFQLVTHREAMGEDEGGEGEDDDGGEEPQISITAAIALMLASTVVVAFSSEMLVNTLEGVVENLGISPHFIGIILLPIVGNACEHASAVRFAIQDKAGLSIGIAVGSSTQISLFVVPASVLVGWIIDQPMELNFGALNVTVMFISVIVVLSVVVDGAANWLQGYLLISAYLIIAVLYWFLPHDGLVKD
eukprot:TRINITY_DN2356_c0_g1_i2.p1 TRINITY_DN2356_c0_g1~~TRINITY_DN2356_c0_g1_i2.p1  ORF type:complete len:465 (+),score=76.25 TRINITY_DN2356_c0_g1_i2:176-1570(+)